MTPNAAKQLWFQPKPALRKNIVNSRATAPQGKEQITAVTCYLSPNNVRDVGNVSK